MKKILLVLISLVLSLMILAACDYPTYIPAEQAPPEYTNNVTGETNGNEVTTVGVITGDVLFNGIAISRLFVEPIVDVLGEPVSYHSAHLNYGYLTVTSSGHLELGHWHGVAIQISAWKPYLNRFEINGIGLNLSREELLATLGNPLEYCAYSMVYHISSPNVNYTLMLEFEDKTEISGIRIFRVYGQ